MAWALYFWFDTVEAVPPASKPSQFAWAPFLVVVGVASAVRLYKIGEFPLGPYIDEIVTLNNSLRVLEHRLDLFGQTPLVLEGWVETTNLYLYFNALILKLFGVSYWSMKLLSIIPGVISCASVFLIGQEIFERRAAFGTALLFTLGHWPIRLSRYGWDASFMVMGFSLSLLLLLSAIQRGRPLYAYSAGMAAGLSLYSYLAARICVISLLGFLIFECVLRRNRSILKHTIAFGTGAALVAFPLLCYYFMKPSTFSVRTAELSIFNRSHDPSWIILKNIWRHALMFHTFGGTYARDNFPGLPMMDPVTGVLFLIGFVILVTSTRTPFKRLVAWALVLNFAGGVFSISREGPPYILRTAAVMIPAFLIAGLALRWLLHQGRRVRLVAWSALLLTIVLNLHHYFALEARNTAAMRVMAYEPRLIGLEIARDRLPVYLVGPNVLDQAELVPPPGEKYSYANPVQILPPQLRRFAVIAFSGRYDFSRTVSDNVTKPLDIYFVETAFLETNRDSIRTPAKIIFKSHDPQLKQILRKDYPNASLRDLRDLFGEPLLTVATLDLN